MTRKEVNMKNTTKPVRMVMTKRVKIVTTKPVRIATMKPVRIATKNMKKRRM